MGGCTSKPSTSGRPDNPFFPGNDYPLIDNPTPSASKASPFFPFYTPSPARHRRNKSRDVTGGESKSVTSTPLRQLRRAFNPPSPAKHIRAALRRRKGKKEAALSAEATEAPPQEEGEELGLDKRFGFAKDFHSRVELGDEIGRGHFGYTCSAKFRKGELKGQVVAVKIIPKSKMTSAIAIEDVRREVKILQALSGHKNLVQFYDAFEDNANVYIAMELCEGGELLDRILARGGKYSEDDAKPVIIQILNVVAFCHLQGVVHRDLKPEDPRRRMSASQALMHPWIRGYDRDMNIPFDILIFRQIKAYLRSSSLRKAALRALSKTLITDEIIYLKTQFSFLSPNKDGFITLGSIRSSLSSNATDEMKETRIPEFLALLNGLQHRGMDFAEFCAAAINVHQHESLDCWEESIRHAYELFERNGNRAIVIEELASELGVGPAITVHSVLHDWIRHTDGKLSFFGFAKLLHGVSVRPSVKTTR
ncbi:hypothetical protein HID58_079353 [Brassica napus]|uniref:non-specific serine/threonine protein kinase n=1 Tax=Brassica napus TaxID=3708 RepID=A0ABQ7Y1S7_BRANA|nr:hypothetical protein HID58_079353 [Brassica napus]